MILRGCWRRSLKLVKGWDNKLHCYSIWVADAGFHAVVDGDEQLAHDAKLYEIWFGGEKPLADLFCDW